MPNAGLRSGGAGKARRAKSLSGADARTGIKAQQAFSAHAGRAELPTGTDRLIRRFEFQLGSPSSPLCNCASVTTGDELRLIFSSNIRETTLPREMLRFLVEKGVPVTVESNMEDD